MSVLKPSYMVLEDGKQVTICATRAQAEECASKWAMSSGKVYYVLQYLYKFSPGVVRKDEYIVESEDD